MTVRVAEIPIELASGSDCAPCATRFHDELSRHGGLVDVEPQGESALRVRYDPDVCSLSCLSDAAREIGARLAGAFHHEVMPIEGMDCYDCAQTIERAIDRLPGVTACSVSFAAARLSVEYDATTAGLPARIRKQVASLGYQVPLADDGDPAAETASSFVVRHRNELRSGAAALLVVAGGLASAFAGHSRASDVFYAVAILVGGWPIARAGLAAMRATRRPDINFLMTLAVIGAAAIDAWFEGALVVVLFSVGEALEGYAVDRARRSIASLVALAPTSAVVLRDGEERQIEAAALVRGDVIVVRPGESVAADGTVQDGTSGVDQATITGESLPVDKERGDQVYAGTLNGEGRLVVQVDRAPGDTTLDRIARAITEAQSQKTPTERWVDRFARAYTPTVLVVAVLTATLPPLLGAGSFGDWFYRGLAFLILACPCALVIATPVAIVAALARASTAGVLVKGGTYLETAAGIRAIAFDKTGTVTAGRPRVIDVVTFGGQERARVLQLAASIETGSEHPLARAMIDAAAEQRIALLPVAASVASRGVGIEGRIEGRLLQVGKPALFGALVDDDPTVAAAVARAHAAGNTVAMVGTPTEILGLVALGDTLRPDAAAALDRLRRGGVEHSVILTGDHEAAATVIAEQVGIGDVRANLLPDDKVAAVTELERQYGSVAMVGDGVNDAPALARASLGIAMGTAGSPTAIETADVALMGDDLGKLAEFFGLARSTRRIVRQNIVFALAVKAIAAVLALAGVLTLWLAVLADVGATLLVVANALRLLREHGSVRSSRPDRTAR